MTEAPNIEPLAAETSPVRVLIVDDHDLYRSGLKAFLSVEPDLEVIGHASGGRLGVQLAVELRPDVVLLDLRMPDLDGIAATREIQSRAPDIRVIILTVSDDHDAVEAAIQAGASGYILKESPVTETIAAVRVVAQGESWLSPRAASAVLDRLRKAEGAVGGPSDLESVLSSRELDILRYLARGLENAEIAQELNISPRTVKNHISSVLAKLGVDNRVQAAIYAVRNGVL